jgi:hypothetical protein
MVSAPILVAGTHYVRGRYPGSRILVPSPPSRPRMGQWRVEEELPGHSGGTAPESHRLPCTANNGHHIVGSQTMSTMCPTSSHRQGTPGPRSRSVLAGSHALGIPFGSRISAAGSSGVGGSPRWPGCRRTGRVCAAQAGCASHWPHGVRRVRRVCGAVVGCAATTRSVRRALRVGGGPGECAASPGRMRRVSRVCGRRECAARQAGVGCERAGDAGNPGENAPPSIVLPEVPVRVVRRGWGQGAGTARWSSPT